jgi:hypothetical protein
MPSILVGCVRFFDHQVALVGRQVFGDGNPP